MKTVERTARLRVELDGSAPEEGLRRRLSRIEVTGELSVPAQCELTFVGGSSGSFSPPAPGSRVRVFDPSATDPVFEGEVTAVEEVFGPGGERETRVRSYDLLHRLRKRQPVRSHREVTFADLVRELTADLGVSVRASEEGPVIPQVIQHRQSDWRLLREMGDRSGLYLDLRGDVVRVMTLEGEGEPVELTYGEDLLDARVERNTDGALSSTEVLAWDPRRAAWHRERAADARSGRRSPAAAPATDVGGTGERSLTDELARDASTAASLGRGVLDRAAAGEVVLEGTADGRPEIRPGRPVRIRGLDDRLDGRYVAARVRHRVDEEAGYVTSFSTEPPPPPPRPAGATATVGVVTSVEDPEGLGRVKVRLPVLGDLETGWLQVVCPGAGTDKGLVALPAPEDRVLLLVPRADPTQGVVLGGLYGEESPPDDGVEGGAVRRYTFRTPGGQLLRLDDEEGLFRVENAAGTHLEAGPDRVVLHAGAELVIEAPGSAVSIRGRSIDFSRA